MSLTVVRASGSPREIGRAQGAGTAEGIAAALRFYGDLGPDMRALGATATPYIDAARAALPDLVEELEGLAQGAGVTFEEIAFLNCMEEVWDFEACTTMVHGRYFLHAEQWYAGHDHVAVVFAAPDRGPGFVSPTCSGFLPAVGVSASGFAQGIDSLTADDNTVGISRVMLSRNPLSARGFDAAVAATDTPDRAGGYAHVFVTASRTAVVETSALWRGVVSDAHAHTNHYLISNAPSGSASKGSQARLARAEQLLIEAPPVSLEDCARLLGDHESIPQSICLHEHGSHASGTVFGIACDLSTGRLIVSDGPPCEGRWQTFEVPDFVPEVHSVV
ncbi:MAG: C45 family peptidase [Actinomycetota bacterium]